ncbi:MAG: tRNA (adenosine(37)-N6)-dimethylallyltransferase MiaA [Candidatus Acidiferrales bacterium]
MMSESRLIAILGPTGSGKSALAIWLAERLDGEILVCDSTQVYRHFDIGTAKPTHEERLRIPHHMLDFLEPHEIFTAGEYRRRAMSVLEDLRSRGKIPILTVGTGLYLRSVLEGLSDAPLRSEELRAKLRHRAREKPDGYLHPVLKRLDADSASRISPRDEQKLIRAIEVCLIAGKPLSEVHRAGKQPLAGFSVVKLGLNPPRPDLYARIDARVHQMFEDGLLAEARRMLKMIASPEAKPWSFIGYARLRTHFENGAPLEDTISKIQQDTRRYAKRQITWFRRESGVRWITGFGEAQSTREAAFRFLETMPL